MKILLFALTLGTALAWAATDEDAVRDAENRWSAAVVAKDVPALEKIFTDNLIYSHATGRVDTKKGYTDRLRSGTQRYDGIKFENTKVVVYGDSAVAHSTARMTGDNGKPFNDHVMMMHYWVKQNGAWRLAAHQTTKLPD